MWQSTGKTRTAEQFVYTICTWTPLSCYQNGQQCCYWITHGVQLKRNNSHVKKYEERIVGQDEKTTLPVDLKPTESATEPETAKFPLLLRPSRVKKLREKFKDFVMNWLFISEIVYCFPRSLKHFTVSLENICTFGFPYWRLVFLRILLHQKDCCSYFFVEFYSPERRRDVVFARYTSLCRI